MLKYRVAALVAMILGFMVLAIATGTTPTNGTATANLSWVTPTVYSDGTPMPASDIASYTITYQSTASPAAKVTSITLPGSATSTTVASLCNTVNFSIAVSTTATAVYPNATSSPDGPVPFVSSVTCVPNAPTNFQAKG